MQTSARWAALIPLFAIPFLSLYIDSSMFFPFITGKNFLFRILVEIAFAGWVVMAFADKRYRPRFSWTLAAFALLVAWMAIADAFAVNPHKAFWSNFERMDGWVTLAHVFLLSLVAGSVLTVDKLWRKWWLTLLSAVALVCGFGLLQLMGAADIHQSGTRLDATLGNSEYLAGFLLLTIPITLLEAMRTRAKDAAWLRYSLFALAALEVVILFSTGTRGAFIALVGGAAFGGLLWLFMAGKQGRKAGTVFLIALIALVGSFYMLRSASFIQESPNLSRLANISLGELETRFAIWGMALEGAKDRPVFGWGHEGFNYVFNAYYEPSLYGQESWFDRAHNIYLDWLIAGGIPALLLFLSLLLSAAWSVYRSRDLDGGERVLLLSAFAAYGIQGLAVFDNLFTYVPLALLLAYAHMLSSRPVPALSGLPEASPAATGTIIAPLAAAAALVALYMVNIPTYAAGKDLIRGLTPQGTAESRLNHFERALAREPFATQEIREQLLQFAGSVVQSPQTSAAEKQEVVAYAASEMEKEIARAPSDARLYVQYSSMLRNTGNFDAARAAAARARELSPQKQTIIMEQGIVEWQAGDPKAARAFFEEAYALKPGPSDLAAYAAAARIMAHDIPAAKELLLQEFGTTTIDHMVIAFAYQETGAWNELIAIMRLRAATSKDAESGYQLAIALAQAGRIEEARAQVRAVMAQFPGSSSDGAALLLQLGVR